MPDSTEITIALVARLSGDSQLRALLPDGVYVNQGRQGATRFALVSLVIATYSGQFGPAGSRRAIEDCLYTVKAVVLDPSRVRAGDACARIDALLEDQPLTITGYHCARVERDEPIDETEVDDVDASIQWQHCGGRYRIVAIPT